MPCHNHANRLTEPGRYTVLASSGQAAVTMVVLAIPMPGDKVLIPGHVFPPVRSFCLNYLQRGTAG
jgi:cystathionine beta-lyase